MWNARAESQMGREAGEGLAENCASSSFRQCIRELRGDGVKGDGAVASNTAIQRRQETGFGVRKLNQKVK